MHRSIAWALAVALGCAGAARAELKPDNLFSDGAVLQRDAKLPVWGTTDRDQPVTVRFAGQEVSATPEKGTWQVELAPLASNSQPSTLTIAQGDVTIERTNILVGDVWICGGQSNMRWMVRQAAGAGPAIATAGNRLLRLYTVTRTGVTARDLGGELENCDRWLVDGPESVPTFSAVGYYFGRELQRSLGVPIGLINSNVGGTGAERWTSRETLAANDELKVYLNRGSSDLWNTMILPLTRFPIRGVIWYQGEANAARAWQYRTLLTEMIKGWRSAWHQGDFPFLIVQLAPFFNNHPPDKEPADSSWAELREAQTFAAETLPNVGQVVITDLGEERNIHPSQKREVGERLAQAARAIAYGQKVEYQGPTFERQTTSGDKIVVNFKHVGAGLVAAGGPLTGFAIAGEDGKFRNATAQIEGNTVVVSSDQVPHPVAVRYGWADFPIVNLWNKEGLPACPFRTDEFPASTLDKE
ncbi:MAG TPA: sialate O-acetylesterase [Pirellulales bacterium]|nr:sialate O-acetylesterase [Pirellulales bacterium]